MKKIFMGTLLFFTLSNLCEAKKQPTVRLVANFCSFSPNEDKIKDEMLFKIKTEKIKSINNWVMQISDKNGNPFKTFSGEKTLPEFLWWNGLDEAIRICSEGIYTATIKILNQDNQILSHSTSFYLDLIPPTVSLTLPPASQTISIYENSISFVQFDLSAVDFSGIDYWQVKIFDEKNNDFSSEKSTAPMPDSWLLKLDHLRIPAENLTATLHVTDFAGNAEKSASVIFEVKRAVEKETDNNQSDSSLTPSGKLIATLHAAEYERRKNIQSISDDKTDFSLTSVELNRGDEIKEENKTAFLRMTSWVSVSDLFENSNPPVLSARARILLTPVSKLILEIPGAYASISGHVDAQSSSQKAKALSSAYAWKVFSFLVKEKGVDKKLLSVKGCGSENPVATNNTLAGRNKNRRIEFQIHFPE